MGNIKSGKRKATNLSIDADLLAEAKALDINLSQTAEVSIRQAVNAMKAKAWQEENAEAIRQNNEWVAKNGLPLEQSRLF